MGLLEDLFQIGDGIRSGVEDAPSFIVNVLSGDVHGAVTDGRNLIGDVTGILDGVEGLGVSLGEVPKRYLGTAAKLADSKILAAAQLAIEGQKAMTGSGDPDEGNGYRDSANRLEETVETLVDAAPHEDRWDGAAAKKYAEVNAVHRRRASDTSVADKAIGEVVANEAHQVIRTRRTLDEASQQLYDFGLATSWMMFVPPLIPAKMSADLAAATAALGLATTAIADLAKNSAENAERIRENLYYYAKVVSDEPTADDQGCDGTLVSQDEDRGSLPRRIAEGDHYTVPSPETPDTAPPAIPYRGRNNDAPAPLLRAATPTAAERGTPGLPPNRSAPSSPPRPDSPAPKVSVVAQGQPATAGRTPVGRTAENGKESRTSE